MLNGPTSLLQHSSSLLEGWPERSVLVCTDPGLARATGGEGSPSTAVPSDIRLVVQLRCWLAGAHRQGMVQEGGTGLSQPWTQQTHVGLAVASTCAGAVSQQSQHSCS